MNTTYALIGLACLAALAVASGVCPARELRLGDGRISTAPEAGYLMSCVQRWRRSPVHGGPWIRGDVWDPARKPRVQGRVRWPEHRMRIFRRGRDRIIAANGLPDHATGRFPISPRDPAYRYDPNPNAIRPQRILLTLPLHPRLAARATCVPMGMIGFALDGVAIYNAVDNGGIDAVAHEVQDRCGGHPDHRGRYHYHGPSPCMPNERDTGLVGYALDGFGIYGMRDLSTGRILHDADLDACHGITSPVRWNGRTVTMYHYVLTAQYPYTIGCFRGTPVAADFTRIQRRQMRRGPGGPRRPARPPRPAFGPPPAR